MSWVKDTFSSSLGKKYIMALSGGFLIVFLLVHLAGNLLLLLNDEGQAFNEYAHFMATHWYISPVGEIVLFAGFLAHIIDGLSLVAKNRKARPVKYGYKKTGSGKVNWVSKKMGLLGGSIFIFLILHLGTFWVEGRFNSDSLPTQVLESTGETVPNLFYEIEEHFESIPYSVFYIVCMVLLALHLQHGFQSAFQSMGWRHPKWTPLFQKVGNAYAIIVPAAFAAIPIYFLIKELL